MSNITPEQLKEIDRLACEQYKMNLIIDYIKDPNYIVMWIGINHYFPLGNDVYKVDDELKIYFQKGYGRSGEYVDLYNADLKDIKVYKEIDLDN